MEDIPTSGHGAARLAGDKVRGEAVGEGGVTRSRVDGWLCQGHINTVTVASFERKRHGEDFGKNCGEENT